MAYYCGAPSCTSDPSIQTFAYGYCFDCQEDLCATHMLECLSKGHNQKPYMHFEPDDFTLRYRQQLQKHKN